MPDSEHLLPELRLTLQSMRSAVNMLRQSQPDTAAVAFMCAGAQARLEQIVQAAEAAGPRARRVLIADPDPGWVEVLGETLRLEGHETRSAATSSDALAACSSFRPQIVLLELAMTGLDAVRNLRGAADPAVLVAVTRWSRESDRAAAMQAGLERFLHKPVSPVAVARLVSALPMRPAGEVTPLRARKRPLRSAR